MTPRPDGSDSSFHGAWSAALAELELDVDACEQLLHAVHGGAHVDDVPAGPGSWAPPTHLGSLPQSLAERARLVLSRQIAVGEQLAQAALHSQQQMQLQQRMRPDHASARSLYVDAAF